MMQSSTVAMARLPAVAMQEEIRKALMLSFRRMKRSLLFI